MKHACGFALWALLATGAALADDLPFVRVQLDARFRSEGVGIADFNKDGAMDVVSGDYWYSAPDWQKHEIRPPGDFWAGVGYSTSFANWTFDINNDGWQDIIIVGFPGAPFHWYENPRGEDKHWTEHLIWHSICNETPLFHDVTGDGRPEIICGSQPEAQMGYLEIPPPEQATQKWTFTPISEPGDPGKNGTHHFYHGLGATDVNGDGRTDVVIPHGWWEAPAKLGAELWAFHPHKLAKSPNDNPLTAADIYAEDLDLDGDMDLMMSCAHQYGVWWFENTASGGEPGWAYHLIDESCSQTHALHFDDLDGDGQRELITGKRFFAHNGHDPGAYELCTMYYFTIKKQKGAPPTFERHEITAGRDTGIGTQFTVTDINGDGKLDIALGNKKGVNLLLQK
ncbi:MAG: FG-GAP and VCBS repeat-containing protein [Planctomycetaceae bacterium]